MIDHALRIAESFRSAPKDPPWPHGIYTEHGWERAKGYLPMYPDGPDWTLIGPHELGSVYHWKDGSRWIFTDRSMIMEEDLPLAGEAKNG